MNSKKNEYLHEYIHSHGEDSDVGRDLNFKHGWYWGVYAAFIGLPLLAIVVVLIVVILANIGGAA